MAGNGQWDNVCTKVNTCALTGAAAFFAGIPDAAVVVNGPFWCYYHALRYLEKSCTGLDSHFFCTQPDNQAIVYGTEECLLEVLQSVRQLPGLSVLLIENSCAVGLIGDDIAGIAAQAGLPCPVICIDSGGLNGGFWQGYRAAAAAYFKAMPLVAGSPVEPHGVNLLGCTVGYYNAGSDVRELKRLLALAGYKVGACPGAGSSTAEIADMSQARLNLVIHEELGHELAQLLERQYGIPYLSLLPPYGLEGSMRWLETLGQTLATTTQGRRQVQREAAELSSKMRAVQQEAERLWDAPWFEKTLVSAPSSVAFSLAQALRSEWVDTGELTVVLQDGQTSYPVPDGVDAVVDGQGDSRIIERQLADLAAGLLLASNNEKTIIRQLAVPDVICQNIALPVYDEVILTDRPFMGLRGACHINERLWNHYIDFCLHGRQKY